MWCSRLGIQYEPSHHLVVAHTHLGLHWLVAHTHPGVHQLVAHTHPGVHSEALGVPGYHTPLIFLDTDIRGMRHHQGKEHHQKATHPRALTWLHPLARAH
jgi:hypothetical protein